MLAPASDALSRGNLQLCELICRELLEQAPNDPTAHLLLGHIASRVGRPDFAVKHYAQALRDAPGHAEARAALGKAAAAQQQRAARAHSTAPRSTRYLIVKAWGNGFWSDVDHVAGQLLLADMTCRIPIVHWGANSLFSAPGIENAFELYFRPASPFSVKDIAGGAATFFPPKWRRDSLRAEDLNKWEGEGARITGLYCLGRDEDVVVSDFHTAVNDLIPWIDERSGYFGMKLHEIYRQLFATQIRLQPHLEQAVQAFWARNMAGGQWLAVHVRGSDKVGEVGNLVEANAAYFAAIDQLLDVRPDLSVFLLTDSEHYLRDCKLRYGSRLLHSACTRTATTRGVHYAGHPGQRLAEEVILDTYLAARCDLFLGNGLSNVSTTVGHLKDWNAGTYFLLGQNQLSVRNLVLHQW
jgi:protein O-GlcNAc transferase